jgi:hypothetical protein
MSDILDADFDAVTKLAMETIQAGMHLKPVDKEAYLEVLGNIAIQVMRATWGDEYARGWLDSAVRSLSEPCVLNLRKPQ